MNIEGLAIDTAVKFSLTQVEAEKIINFILQDIAKSLSRNERVYFRGFGKFERIKRKAKRVRNPETKRMMFVPAYYTVKFTPSVALLKKK